MVMLLGWSGMETTVVSERLCSLMQIFAFIFLMQLRIKLYINFLIFSPIFQTSKLKSLCISDLVRNFFGLKLIIWNIKSNICHYSGKCTVTHYSTTVYVECSQLLFCKLHCLTIWRMPLYSHSHATLLTLLPIDSRLAFLSRSILNVCFCLLTSLALCLQFRYKGLKTWTKKKKEPHMELKALVQVTINISLLCYYFHQKVQN